MRTVRRWSLCLLIILIFSFNIVMTSAEEESNVGILRVRSFRAPRAVAPNSAFQVSLDVEYGLHGRPENDTIRVAIYKNDVKLQEPIWQTESRLLWSEPWGGEKVWNVNITSPSVEGEFKLTAYAFYSDEGTWRYFNDSISGPGIKQVTVKIGKTANLDVKLGISNLPIVVDNVTVNTMNDGNARITLVAGENYLVSIPYTVQFQNSTRIAFDVWNDGSKLIQRNVLLNENLSLIGSYKIQYLLKVNSLNTPSLEWYDAGAIVKLHAQNSIPINSSLGPLMNFRYNFVDWTGDIRSSQQQINITMNSPKTINANYSFDYSPLIIIAAIATGVAGTCLLVRRRRKTTQKQSVLLCRNCGEPIERDWVYCNHCRTRLANHELNK